MFSVFVILMAEYYSVQWMWDCVCVCVCGFHPPDEDLGVELNMGSHPHPMMCVTLCQLFHFPELQLPLKIGDDNI